MRLAKSTPQLPSTHTRFHGSPARHSVVESPDIQRSRNNLFFDPLAPPEKPPTADRSSNFLSPGGGLFKSAPVGLLYFLDWGYSSGKSSPASPGATSTQSEPARLGVQAQPLPGSTSASARDDEKGREMSPHSKQKEKHTAKGSNHQFI